MSDNMPRWLQELPEASSLDCGSGGHSSAWQCPGGLRGLAGRAVRGVSASQPGQLQPPSPPPAWVVSHLTPHPAPPCSPRPPAARGKREEISLWCCVRLGQSLSLSVLRPDFQAGPWIPGLMKRGCDQHISRPGLQAPRAHGDSHTRTCLVEPCGRGPISQRRQLRLRGPGLPAMASGLPGCRHPPSTSLARESLKGREFCSRGVPWRQGSPCARGAVQG